MSKTGVFILRGQPIHNAHIAIINRILTENQHTIILIGSANNPSTFKNPFDYPTRMHLINQSITVPGSHHVSIRPINDYLYDDLKWATQVQQVVTETAMYDDITLYGHVKEDTEYYLSLFGTWKSKNLPAEEPLNATMIRNLYFSDQYNPNMIAGVVPKNVLEYLNKMHGSGWWKQIVDENEFILKQKDQYKHLPYPIIFSTADAVVTQGANILLIKRRSIPGKGQWALPGGYINALSDKSVLDASIRELREETKIKVSEQVLRRCIVNNKVFDHPERSPRGRIITHAFHYDLLPDREFPKVMGSDDAEKAKWFPLNTVTRDMMFEDHWHIISHFTGI